MRTAAPASEPGKVPAVAGAEPELLADPLDLTTAPPRMRVLVRR